jgi:hypothetical protein
MLLVLVLELGQASVCVCVCVCMYVCIFACIYACVYNWELGNHKVIQNLVACDIKVLVVLIH